MKNGWTGGQYSVFRAFLGLYLLTHFAGWLSWAAERFSDTSALPDRPANPLIFLFPNVLALWDSPLAVRALLAVAIVLSALLAIGKRDRWAALGIWYVLTCFLGRYPLVGNPSWPYVGWLLLAHAFVPRAPYGSWDARSRVDPAGGWRLPAAIFLVAWILMAAGYTYSGWTRLVGSSWVEGTAPSALPQLATWGVLVVELSFAPLALFRRLRPWPWMLTLLMHLGLMTVPGSFDMSMGMVVFHVFTFDPAWMAPKRAQAAEWLYYDGSCGLCHRTVRFVLAEDRSGEAFRFAPIGGDHFKASIPDAERRALPDSLVLRTSDGRLLTRSAGVLHLLARLGGLWRVAAFALRVLPTAARDAAYDLVAAIRYKLFARPTESCPLVPASLRERFDV